MSYAPPFIYPVSSTESHLQSHAESEALIARVMDSRRIEFFDQRNLMITEFSNKQILRVEELLERIKLSYEHQMGRLIIEINLFFKACSDIRNSGAPSHPSQDQKIMENLEEKLHLYTQYYNNTQEQLDAEAESLQSRQISFEATTMEEQNLFEKRLAAFIKPLRDHLSQYPPMYGRESVSCFGFHGGRVAGLKGIFGDKSSSYVEALD